MDTRTVECLFYEILALKVSAVKKRSRRYWLRLLLTGVTGGALFGFATIEVMFVHEMTRPARSAICCVTPADLGFEYEEVSFVSGGGVTLRGWHVPPQNGVTIILLHGYGDNRVDMLSRAVILAKHGYGALLYDMRAHGESEGDLRTFGWLDVEDVSAALDFLQGKSDVNPERIGILGFSIGGQIALRAAAQMQAIGAVVGEEPGFVSIDDAPAPASPGEYIVYVVNWVGARGVELRTGVSAPVGIVDVIGEIAPRPLLLISAGEGLGRRLVKHLYDRASEPKALWEISETYHGGAPAARPEEYEERVVGFFDRTLLESE